MKSRTVIFIIALVIFADQALKIWVKTHYNLNDSHNVIGSGFKLYFVENPGMAYGLKLFKGEAGKLVLSLFRLGAVIFGVWYLRRIIQHKYHKGFIFCAALIYAGALGNLIDSTFYGVLFDKGMLYNPQLNDYMNYEGIATFTSKKGYNAVFYGNVVDMLYFPVIKSRFPSWFPFWGGQDFEFFRPIFNLADAAISTGVISILLFQKRFFKHRKNNEHHPVVETAAMVNDEVHVS
ncbi:MAG: lipoprotein signal peptidase [Ferruginibacter sp.]